MYVATRGLYNLKPPTVFVPPCIKEDVERLMDIHRSMGQVELNLELVPLDIGNKFYYYYFTLSCCYLLRSLTQIDAFR